MKMSKFKQCFLSKLNSNSSNKASKYTLTKIRDILDSTSTNFSSHSNLCVNARTPNFSYGDRALPNATLLGLIIFVHPGLTPNLREIKLAYC